jgi:hypothetical protein
MTFLDVDLYENVYMALSFWLDTSTVRGTLLEIRSEDVRLPWWEDEG